MFFIRIELEVFLILFTIKRRALHCSALSLCSSGFPWLVTPYLSVLRAHTHTHTFFFFVHSYWEYYEKKWSPYHNPPGQHPLLW